ncbi:diphthamide biosynthesis protein [Salix suchowensis]|nr:diphthamide biosynthesis protein [Salix suchowensis]
MLQLFLWHYKCLDGIADPKPYHNVLAAATYKLQEGDRPSRFDLFYHVQTAGIFDFKWSPVGCNCNVGQCLLKLMLMLLILDTGDSLSLIGIDGEKISSKCLCLDWNPPATSISVGLSDGFVSAFSFPESQLDVIQEWKAHEFELWAASFHIHQPHDNILLTGSYDEYLRLWDVRSISKPVNETLVCSGGGVWRVKHHPYVPGMVLAACMHNGFASLPLGQNLKCTKHGSVAYGADWQKRELSQKVKQNSSLVATCSLYDRLLRIWIPESCIVKRLGCS